MEGEGFREDPFEAPAVGRRFETNLASMKGKRESKCELKSLDAKLEPRQRRARLRGRRFRRHRLKDPPASVFAGLVILLDGLHELDDAFGQ